MGFPRLRKSRYSWRKFSQPRGDYQSSSYSFNDASKREIKKQPNLNFQGPRNERAGGEHSTSLPPTTTSLPLPPIQNTTSTMSLSSKLSIKDVSLKGERVLIRVDFNVPMDKKTNEITNPAVSFIVLPFPSLSFPAAGDGSKLLTLFELGSI